MKAPQWQLTSIYPVGDGRYRAVYLIHGNERHSAVIVAGYDLERAIPAIGMMLSQFPPMHGAYLGSHDPREES